ANADALESFLLPRCKVKVRIWLFAVMLICLSMRTFAQSCADSGGTLVTLFAPHDYLLKRVSSYDRSGGNADARQISAGDALTILDETGPGVITHICLTIASRETYHLK